MNIVEIITRHLRTNRRLVVPALGAFVVKEPTGEVLFTELLKDDDGVLRSLLAAEGLDELDCAMVIDRFVFDIRHVTGRGERFYASELGFLSLDADGTLRLNNHSAPCRSDEEQRRAAEAERENEIRSKVEAVRQRQRSGQAAGEAAVRPDAEATWRGAADGAADGTASEQVVAEEPDSVESPAVETEKEGLLARIRRVSDALAARLHGGKKRMQRGGGIFTDTFIVLAAVAAFIALAAVIYGFFCSQKMDDFDDLYIEKSRVVDIPADTVQAERAAEQQ